MNNKRRFFEIDHETKWRLNDNSCPGKNVCYICEKQKYCLIFYERNKTLMINNKDINTELIEITDPIFLDKMRSDYRLRYSNDVRNVGNITSPLICGTLVRNR